jgi:hypothetical protein
MTILLVRVTLLMSFLLPSALRQHPNLFFALKQKDKHFD